MSLRRDTWRADGDRRHWVLKSHCECLLFPSQQPSLSLPSCHGRRLWNLHAVSGRHPALYQRQLSSSLRHTLRSWAVDGARSAHLVLSDQLFKVTCMDPATRAALVRQLELVLRSHSGLQTVSLENCGLSRCEGTRLLSALAASSAFTLKELHLQGAFAADKSPLQEDTTPPTFIGSPGFLTKMSRGDYEKALSTFTSLRFLALNYGQLTAEVLVQLAIRTPANLQLLQLLCLEHELESPAVPDDVWKLAVRVHPQLTVSLVIVGVAEYEKIRSFLRPSMPLRHLCVSSGLQLSRGAPWDFNVTLRLLAAWYRPSLEVLCIHLHRSREYLDTMLSDVFSQFPRLQSLEFIGLIHETHVIEDMCCTLLNESHHQKPPRKVHNIPGTYCMLRLRIRAQESTSADVQQVMEAVASIQREYQESLALLGVELDLGTYKI